MRIERTALALTLVPGTATAFAGTEPAVKIGGAIKVTLIPCRAR